MTPANNTPLAWAIHELLVRRNVETSPHKIICTVGQYISSNIRGQEVLRR